LEIASTEEVTFIFPPLDIRDSTPAKAGRLRNRVTQELAEELKEVDEIVKRIIER
jgi:hypothetical protein